MTALVEGAKRLVGKGSSDVAGRVEGLEQAVEAARGRLDDAVVDDAAAVVQRAGARLKLSAEHTVVALAGATGSGKSSTFNAITDLDLAAVGVKRPTTSWTMACTWGAEGSAELLDWLGVPGRHQVSRNSMLDSPSNDDKDLHGLVLLDLPDHDSTEVAHHVEVDRLVKTLLLSAHIVARLLDEMRIWSPEYEIKMAIAVIVSLVVVLGVGFIAYRGFTKPSPDDTVPGTSPPSAPT